MVRFMQDHPGWVLAFVGLLASCTLGVLYLILTAEEDQRMLCLRCGKQSYLHDLSLNNEAWACPYCGMDESGLIVMRKEDQNRP